MPKGPDGVKRPADGGATNPTENSTYWVHSVDQKFKRTFQEIVHNRLKVWTNSEHCRSCTYSP